jgi:hypothetical protein
MYLSNAALDQPHYFVDTSDLTLKDRIRLQRPQASATMTLIQAIPIKKTPLKKMTALAQEDQLGTHQDRHMRNYKGHQQTPR